MRVILLLCPFGKSEGDGVSKQRKLVDASKAILKKAAQAKDARAREDVREFADRMLEPGMRDKEQEKKISKEDGGRRSFKRSGGGGVEWARKKLAGATTGAGQRARVAAAH